MKIDKEDDVIKKKLTAEGIERAVGGKITFSGGANVANIKYVDNSTIKEIKNEMTLIETGLDGEFDCVFKTNAWTYRPGDELPFKR